MQDPMAAAFQTMKPMQFPEKEQHLRCPRCDSTDTKFCYYNNYNLSQPRHFCKNCRRYWTKGGALRNIPVGGGTRKNSKRSSSSSSSPTTHPKRSNNPSSAVAAATAPPLQNPKIEPISALCPPTDHSRQMLDITGSFSSLLASNRHFGNLLESFNPGDPGVFVLPSSNDLNQPIGISALELHSPSNGSDSSGNPAPPQPPVPDNILGLQGDSSCWNGSNGWPDLAIYTPGSSFQ